MIYRKKTTNTSTLILMSESKFKLRMETNDGNST